MPTEPDKVEFPEGFDPEEIPEHPDREHDELGAE